MDDEKPDTAVRHGKAALTWISLAARVILGGAILYAGLIKLPDLSQSVTAVRAYQLPWPGWIDTAAGYGMPIAEVILGAAILAGLFTRWTAMLGALMMLVYIGLISSAWARGLAINCGCFSPGGFLPPGESTKYLQDILRDIGLTICGVWLMIWPRSVFSVDGWIAGADAGVDADQDDDTDAA